MNLTGVIREIRAQWASAMPSTPLYLQLAPETAQPPYAVARLDAISLGDGDTATQDYETTLTFVAFFTSDIECFEAIDAINEAFDRSDLTTIYFSMLNSASFDLDYTEQAALWAASLSFSIRWTREA